MPGSTDAFCIYINTVLQGPTPIERNPQNLPVTYSTREAAEREIAEDCIERLQQFLASEREFGDAITVEEFVMPVSVAADGSITDEDGRVFPIEGW